MPTVIIMSSKCLMLVLLRALLVMTIMVIINIVICIAMYIAVARLAVMMYELVVHCA